MRLLWLTERYYPERGGMAQSCDRIVTALRDADVLVDVVHLREKGGRFQCASRRNGRDMTVPLGSDTAHALNRFWSTLTANHADASWSHVVAFGGQVVLLAAPVFAAWLRVPLITLLRGNDFDTGIFSVRQRGVLREAIERAARVCVVSRDKGERITALYPHIHPVWIPNSIDLENWSLLPSERKRAETWRAQHVAEGQRVLGMFGQIKPKKGGLFFLKTLLASGHAERFHLLIVGEVNLELDSWLTEHTPALNHSRFPFVDRADLPWHYAACDLVAVTSFYDGLPNVVLEAAALGVPLLAAHVGGMADVLDDEQHGFLFAPGDPHDCRRAIMRAATAPDEVLQQYGTACRALVKTHLSHQQEQARYLAVLRDTLPPQYRNHTSGEEKP